MWSPVIISIKTAVMSTAIVLILGIIFALISVKKEFVGKNIFETLLTMPLVIPPSITGYLLLIILGKNGPIGKLIYEISGGRIIFTWWAGVIAAVVVSIPLMYQSIKASLLSVEDGYLETAQLLGANRIQRFFYVTLPLSKSGILAGIVLSFCRAMGEFGATLMVAGNMPGKTQTIPLAVYFAVDAGDWKKANILMAVVVVSSFMAIYAIDRFNKNI